MARKHWTTPNQRKWLEALLPVFVEAQEKGTVKAFYPQVYEDWEKEFPYPEPTDAETQKAGSIEQAKRAQKRTQDNVSEC